MFVQILLVDSGRVFVEPSLSEKSRDDIKIIGNIIKIMKIDHAIKNVPHVIITCSGPVNYDTENVTVFCYDIEKNITRSRRRTAELGFHLFIYHLGFRIMDHPVKAATDILHKISRIFALKKTNQLLIRIQKLMIFISAEDESSA